METVNNIYEEYDGVADWEEIKLFIADAIETYGITYVLLAGGHKGQTDEWWIPDFRSHNWNPLDTYDPPYDETFSADLYFADVYYIDAYGFHAFEDWDTTLTKKKNDGYFVAEYEEDKLVWVFFCKPKKSFCEYHMWPQVSNG